MGKTCTFRTAAGILFFGLPALFSSPAFCREQAVPYKNGFFDCKMISGSGKNPAASTELADYTQPWRSGHEEELICPAMASRTAREPEDLRKGFSSTTELCKITTGNHVKIPGHGISTECMKFNEGH